MKLGPPQRFHSGADSGYRHFAIAADLAHARTVTVLLTEIRESATECLA
jgi:hypothetical protein